MAINGTQLLSASGSKMNAWDLRKIASKDLDDAQRLKFGMYDSLSGNTGGVWGHLVSGDRLLTAGVDRTMRVWSLRTLQCTNSVYGHTDYVRDLAVAAGRVITCSDDKTVRLWDVETLQLSKTLSGHTNFVPCVKVMRGRIFSGSMDKTIRVWE